jgi:uncharacterized membrane protein
MPNRFINESIFNYIFYNEWASVLAVNQYPLLIIIWNLLLLLIPFIIVRALSSYYFKKGQDSNVFSWLVLGAGGLVWLLFIPNSAYIITGVRHLMGYCPLGSFRDVCVDNAWMIMFFFIYAASGWIFFVLLMNQMRDFLIKISNKKIAGIFVYATIPAIALGVLLGLINRFNSWEIFFEPLIIFKVMLIYVTNLTYFINWLAFTLGLYILYIAGNILFKKNTK